MEVPQRPPTAGPGVTCLVGDVPKRLGVAGIGFAAQIFQVLALREVLGQVEGSEAAVGVTLAGWLLGGAAGVAFGRRPAARTADPARLLGIAAVAAAGLAIAALLAVRFARGWLPLAPGEVPGIGTGLLLAAAGGLVPALGYGFAFPAAARLLDGTRAYAVEAAGALLGGVLFTFVLAPLLPPAGTAALALAFSAAPFLRATPWPARIALAAGLAGLLAGPAVEHATREAAWSAYLPGHRLLATGQSRYGPLDVLGLRGQASLYRYGHLDFTSPDPEGAALKAHLALCLYPRSPGTILLSGGGPGVVREALLHHPGWVVYTEQDSLALAVATEWLAPADRGVLRNSNIAVVPQDARVNLHFWRRRKEEMGDGQDYSTVAIFGTEPSTAAANRLYTEEFFADAAGAMAADGVLILSLRGAGEYLAPDLLRRNALVLAAARTAFRWVAVIPGEAGYLVASNAAFPPSLDPGVLAARFRERGIVTPGMTAEEFHLLLPGDEAARHLQALETAASSLGGERNTDASPAAFHRTLLLRTAEQGSPIAPLFGAAALWIGAAVLLAILAGLAFRGGAGDASVATTGFSGMGLAVLVLLGYQSSRGDLYGEIGLLSGLFMAGLAAGSRARLPLCVADLSLAAVCLAAPLAYGSPPAFFAVSAVAGFCTGATFPAALAAGGDAARLYTLDLAGAALGALLAGTLILPAAGIWAVVVLFAGVKLVGAAASLVRLRGSSPPAPAPASPG